MSQSIRKRSVLAVAVAAAIALAPALADARAAGGASAGSRGTRTFQSAPSTPTAPAARPVERSATAPNQRPQYQPSQQSAPRPSWFQRNPFMSGLMGGLLGAGLIGMLFGGGFFGADFGFTMLFGLLLQLALIGGLVWLIAGVLRRRTAAPAPPAYAMAGGPLPRSGLDIPGSVPAALGHSGGSRGTRDEIGVSPADLEQFERLLGAIQSAWTGRDLGTLQRHLTPEMAGYFSDALAADAQRGVANRVEQVKLEQGDVAEAWAEGDARYATVAMRWSALDYTVRASDGTVVSGNPAIRSEATEVWTFRRDGRGPWLLSAIQQV